MLDYLAVEAAKHADYLAELAEDVALGKFVVLTRLQVALLCRRQGFILIQLLNISSLNILSLNLPPIPAPAPPPAPQIHRKILQPPTFFINM